MTTYYIGADVHCNNTELAIEHNGKIVRRYSLPTTVPAIRDALNGVEGHKHLALEEGPLAGWLYRNLVDHVDELVVCDPRRNKWIASDGDKDDRISAAKLASLLRGGYLQPVYQSRNQPQVSVKRWVALYHDRVKDATRSINKIRACCQMCGVRVPRRAIRDQVVRRQWLVSLESEDLAEQLGMLWMGYDTTAAQVRLARQQLGQRAGAFKIIGYWSKLPGMGLIRSVTLFAYLDTPWRFKRKNQLCRYCGVGLQRASSGQDRYGREHPSRLKLAWAVNKRLKNVVIGAALSAIHSRDNVFRRDYERMVSNCQGALRATGKNLR
jgi:transposase